MHRRAIALLLPFLLLSLACGGFGWTPRRATPPAPPPVDTPAPPVAQQQPEQPEPDHPPRPVAVQPKVARPKVAARFDPKSAENTLLWLRQEVQPVLEARTSGNDLLRADAMKRMQATLDGLKGRKVEWPMTLGGVSKVGIGVNRVSYPIKVTDIPLWEHKKNHDKLPVYTIRVLQAGEKTGDMYLKIPQTEWMKKAHNGLPVLVKATIDGGELKSFAHTETFKIYVKDVEAAPN